MTSFYKNQEEENLAQEIISLETAALDKWFNGDTTGYLNLWSTTNFTYFDGAFDHRVDTYDEIKEFLGTIHGKLFAKSYDFINPRVQFGNDMAPLTYQLHADTMLIDMHYNCIELFHKEGNEWKVIHSTWSFIRPMDIDFHKAEAIV